MVSLLNYSTAVINLLDKNVKHFPNDAKEKKSLDFALADKKNSYICAAQK